MADRQFHRGAAVVALLALAVLAVCVTYGIGTTVLQALWLFGPACQ